ncbi:MAG: DUF3179 domain-containing protein [Gammaproteobacteria bacterium]|nr:MAG: DUF3179 domain-containing protein [Gammaproteobacteria bacterium]
MGHLHTILHSRAWRYRLLRIAVLATVGWWTLKASGLLVRDELPWDKEWPRTDFSRKTVDLLEISSGGVPKDGIPAIDEPDFVSPADADNWLDAREPVIVVQRGERARAYPLQILIYHEIVNDTFEGLPISVTFCPLCNASLVFDRRVAGDVLDFGTTGKLRKSDLVMYDRQTQSWWQQFTGRGIVGQYAGTKLDLIPSQIVAYEDFKKAYPRGQVLSRRTGYLRPYGNNPYRGYDRIGDNPFLFNGEVDDRLPAMERVLGVMQAGRSRVYPFSAFKGQGIINDEFAGLPVVIIHKRSTLSALDASRIKDSRMVYAATGFDRRVDDRVLTFELADGKIVDRETSTQWNQLGQAVAGKLKGQSLRAVDNGVHFAFAWLAFRPDSEIYKKTENVKK